MPQHRHFVRDVHSADLIEIVLVTAIASVLTVRALLAATGYPQMGGKHLHIAHVLWGGFFMITGLIILFRYWNPSIRRVAALVAGVGFGLFIDELGKFLTQNNDYFYKPAIALIYVVFMFMFLLLRSMEHRKVFGEEELALNDVMDRLDAVPGKGRLSRYHKLLALIEETYRSAAKHDWFTLFLGVAFVVLGCSQVLAASGFLFYRPRAIHIYVVQTIVASGSCVFILLGLGSLRNARLHAYTWFYRAVLVNIFLTQPFLFYSWQLGALAGLGVNVLFYAALRYAMSTERANDTDKSWR